MNKTSTTVIKTSVTPLLFKFYWFIKLANYMVDFLTHEIINGLIQMSTTDRIEGFCGDCHVLKVLLMKQ